MRFLMCLLAGAALALPAAAQQYAPKDVLVTDFQRQKVVLLRYIDLMPDDQLGFTPTPGARTFAGQIAHVAQLTGGTLGRIIRQRAPHGDSTVYLRNKSALRDFVARNYDFAIAAVQSLKPIEMVRISDLHDLKWPNWKWILATQEHAAWILGATGLYLSLNGHQAPNYLPF